MSERKPLITPTKRNTKTKTYDITKATTQKSEPKTNIKYERLVGTPSPCTPLQSCAKKCLPPKLKPKRLFCK